MRRAPSAQPAIVALILSFLLRFVNAGSMGPGVPENITVTFLNPTTVRVSWSTTAELLQSGARGRWQLGCGGPKWFAG
ncbi:unnamed protein product [Leptidea sinapis]|uniref:Fibronectin type-III domain-containing protein n=1 Tax=Leptidea sinapis TaxID=189913 RepID=A0A5E4R4L2_9NEOP|nr:unnamed protein product [Leptidea sinapis]